MVIVMVIDSMKKIQNRKWFCQPHKNSGKIIIRMINKTDRRSHMDGRVFVLGCILVVVGLLIVVFDYPQILHLQGVTDPALQDISNRIQIEFGIGMILVLAGPTMMVWSVIRGRRI